MDHRIHYSFADTAFYCPHCDAGPFATRNEMRKHIFDEHIKEGAAWIPQGPEATTRAEHHNG